MADCPESGNLCFNYSMNHSLNTDAWDSLEARIVACRVCPRLVAWREETARVKRRAYRDEEYWGRPVPGFGDRAARVLIVGLAPAAHGGNRTGRVFTGDSSGDFYPPLSRLHQPPTSRRRDDGLALTDVYVRGQPVRRRTTPTPEELNTCRPYLVRRLRCSTACRSSRHSAASGTTQATRTRIAGVAG